MRRGRGGCWTWSRRPRRRRGCRHRARDGRRHDGVEGDGDGDEGPVRAIEPRRGDVDGEAGGEQAAPQPVDALEASVVAAEPPVGQDGQHAARAGEEALRAGGAHEDVDGERAHERGVVEGRGEARAPCLEGALRVQRRAVGARGRPNGRRREGDGDRGAHDGEKGVDGVAHDRVLAVGVPLVVRDLSKLRARRDQVGALASDDDLVHGRAPAVAERAIDVPAAASHIDAARLPIAAACRPPAPSRRPRLPAPPRFCRRRSRSA